jgi:hypothetical protein
MANENENTIPEGTEGTDQPKHHTWKDIISEEFQKINTEFPLSGGETEGDLEGVDDKEEGEETGENKKETKANPPAEEHKEHHSFLGNIVEKIQKLDTEFPLSGGETEEDLEGIDDKEEDEK